MKQNEILAAIHQLKEQLAKCQCQIAVLEELLTKEESAENTQEIPVINEEEGITLPDPPDEECILGCKIITKLPYFYDGKCSVLRLHKQYFDNGKPKLYLNKYKVEITALNNSMQEIGRIVTHWDNLAEYHLDLIKLGINTHDKKTWMPKVIHLDLG